MNKVIAALDGFKPSDSTIDYAAFLAKGFNAHIVATFLEEIVYHPFPKRNDEDGRELDYYAEVDTLVKEGKDINQVSIQKLQSIFDAKKVPFNVHKDKFIAIEALLNESHFADMILIDVNESFSNWDDTKPSSFIKKLLAHADCPVMLVPNEFKPIDKFVFAYDGSASSAYAIRQFSYLFPVTPPQEVEILMVTNNKHSSHFPNHRLLKELLKRKYIVVTQSVIRSKYTVDAMVDHFKAEAKNCMVVLGSYQRSSLSRWLHESTADALISSIDIPLFIAHK
jgi:hypothetical protein